MLPSFLHQVLAFLTMAGNVEQLSSNLERGDQILDGGVCPAVRKCRILLRHNFVEQAEFLVVSDFIIALLVVEFVETQVSRTCEQKCEMQGTIAFLNRLEVLTAWQACSHILDSQSLKRPSLHHLRECGRIAELWEAFRSGMACTSFITGSARR